MLSSAKDIQQKDKIKRLVILYGCLFISYENSEEILSWNELYSCALEILTRSDCMHEANQSDEINMNDDRLTWITNLCQNAKHLLAHSLVACNNYQTLTH